MTNNEKTKLLANSLGRVLEGEDNEPPALEVVAAYMVMRAVDEGKTKDDLVLMIRKAWDDQH